MKKILIYGSIVIVAGVVAYFVFFKKEAAAIQLETVKTKKGSITRMVTATGTVEPLTEVEVGTQVSGVIEKIYVDYNSKVKANQLIAELDKTTLTATMTEAVASLNTALNEQDYLQKTFDRTEKLYKNNVVSQTDYEEALYKLNNAKGVVDQKRSDVKKAKTNLSYANIYSPIDGVVLSRSVDVGQTVAASYSTPTLFTIAQDLNKMQVEADVDEADIGQVKTGQRVTFTVDAYPDDQFTGTVTQVRLEPVEESNVITYTVIIQANNPEGKLMPGLTATVSIYTFELNDVITLEAKAFNFKADPAALDQYREQNGLAPLDLPPPAGANAGTPPDMADKNEGEAKETNKKTVWVKAGTDIKPRQIITGSTDGINTEITEGLKENEEVIFSMSAATQTQSAGGQSSSPFMPKPPGRKSK